MKYPSSNDGQQKASSRSLAALWLCSVVAIASHAQANDAAIPNTGGAAITLERAKPSAKAADDAQARFSEGVNLAKERKMAQAIKVFTELARDYPDLAEPLNNLGVLYEESGELDRARAALELAVKKDPRYATAYENLGDLFTQIASLFYEKALRINAGSNAAHSNVTTLSSVGGLPSRGRPVKFAEITAATEADTLEQLGNDYAQLAYRAYSRTRQIDPAAKGISLKLSLLEKVIGDRPAEAARPVAEKKRALVFSDDGPAAPQTLASVSENFAVRESSQRTPSAQPIQAKPSATPTASAVKPESGARNKLDDPLTVVNEWANAWSARDVARYLSFYAPSFKTPMGQSADAWKKSRATRISEKSHIKVTVESPRLTVDGDIANVKFRQIYVSDRVREASGKILVLTRRGDTWQILEERAGS